MKSFWKPSLQTTTAMVVGIVLMNVANVSQAQNSKGGTGQRVQSVIIQKQNIVRSVEMSGTVKGFNPVELFSPTGGFLKDISADSGFSCL